MRFASPLALQSAAIYGLLTVAHALPSLINHEDGTHGSPEASDMSIVARMPPTIKNPFSRPKEDPAAPGGGGKKPPGSDPPKPPPGGGLRPDTIATDGSGRTPNQRGKDYVAEMRTTFASDNPRIDPMDDFYSNRHNFDIKRNALAGHPESMEYKVFPLEEKAGAGINGMAPFESTVNLREGRMALATEYRKGPMSTTYYGNIPEANRPYVSSYISDSIEWAKTHTPGELKPVTSIGIENKKNTQMTTKIEQWQREGRGNDFKISEDDVDKADWEWVLGSDLGSPVAQATLKRPDLFEKHRPAEVRIFRNIIGGVPQGMWQGEFTLKPGPPPAW